MIAKFGTQKKSGGRFVTVKLRTRMSAPDRRRLLMGKGPPRWLKRFPSSDVTDYKW